MDLPPVTSAVFLIARSFWKNVGVSDLRCLCYPFRDNVVSAVNSLVALYDLYYILYDYYFQLFMFCAGHFTLTKYFFAILHSRN
jgi:hypothetical protein